MYIKSLNFSLWADFIERDYLEGEFQDLIAKKIINGATSNPAIFKNAILTSPAYKEQLSQLSGSAKDKYEALAITDIQRAADLLKPLYDEDDDGFVSIEVDPNLCDDAQGTIAEGERLYARIDRENIMIKVPATQAGFKAMEVLTAQGIHVNATLIFSLSDAMSCAKAFALGAEQASEKAYTVISVFVSRVDRLLDEKMKAAGLAPGKLGIYNAARIYNIISTMNVPQCRVLFASTGVKGDAYIPSYYIDQLIGASCINTAPIDTIHAYVEHGDVSEKLPLNEEGINAHLAGLEQADIDLESVLKELKEDGIKQFKDAFTQILKELE
ncbi:transaldolase [Sulfurimonas sp. MAG313]|nr:transaldolase [Sulfurimonas sp. MAG313]MDF1879947.1 transaldolase [Sulfurimonas sp. MAG313]